MVTSVEIKMLRLLYLVTLTYSMVNGPTLLNVLKLEPVEFQLKYVGLGINFVQCANLRNGSMPKTTAT